MQNKEIVLEPSLYLASGGERLCYIHPGDSTKIIKVMKKDSAVFSFSEKESRRRNDNLLDQQYFNHIKNSVTDFSHITRCWGFVSTDMGEGLVADRVVNADGSAPLNMRQAVEKNVLTSEEEHRLLSELSNYLLKNDIIFADAKLHNTLLHKAADGSQKLIIVDGLGARKKCLKTWLHIHVKPVRHIRIRQQIKKLMLDYSDAVIKSGRGK